MVLKSRNVHILPFAHIISFILKSFFVGSLMVLFFSLAI